MKWVSRILSILALASCIESAYLAYSIIVHPPMITQRNDPHLLFMQALWCAATVLFGALAYGYMRRCRWSLVLTTIGLIVWLLILLPVVFDNFFEKRATDYLFDGIAFAIPVLLWVFLVKHRQRIFDT
jgi:hypothetical protein